MMPAVLLVFALLALFIVWQWAQRERNVTGAAEARALATPAAQTPVVAEPASPLPEPTVPADQPTAPPEPDAEPIPPADNVADAPTPPAPAEPVSPPVTAAPATVATNVAPVAAPLPKPVPLRLQALVFNPKRPSALINGKTLFIGEKLGDARVVAIDRESATLVSPGRTNILILAD
jgi:outer membrane biosynthesis protein TonB